MSDMFGNPGCWFSNAKAQLLFHGFIGYGCLGFQDILFNLSHF